MKKLMIAVCALLLLALSRSASAAVQFTGTADIVYIQLHNSTIDPASHAEVIVPCNVDIVFYYEGVAYPIHGALALGTQLNLALLKYCNEGIPCSMVIDVDFSKNPTFTIRAVDCGEPDC